MTRVQNLADVHVTFHVALERGDVESDDWTLTNA